MYERLFISLTVPLGLLAAAAIVIGAAWWWMGMAVPMPAAPLVAGEKLQCVSYAPFRGDQNPLSDQTRVSAAQIDEDLARLKSLTDCVRTYSIEHGLDQIPEIARKHGMKVIHGVWLSSNAEKNKVQIATSIALAKRFPDVIQSIVVGNEVLLRGEISATDLAQIIRQVKSQVSVPVTYADVWEFWLRYREIYDVVDFVTIHILPYWEDFPIPAKDAVAHVDSIRRRMVAAFPNKDILIGETGWPSAGRMREGALPSLANQALVLQGVLALAKRDNFKVNVIEAFDQPWKRRLEGTAGGYWGLFDATTREQKFPWGAPVSNHPHWQRQALAGILLAAFVFIAGGIGRLRLTGSLKASVPAWLAVATNAATAGIFVVLAIELMFVESLGLGGWSRSIALVGLAGAIPLAGSVAIMRQTAIAPFAAVLAWKRRVPGDRLAAVLGLLLVALTVLAIQVALGLVFDPRYKDLPYAPLSASIVPLLLLSFMTGASRRKAGAAERLSAATLALSAVYILFNETLANWQSVWFCALVAGLAVILIRLRDADAPG
jgi:exo-beta-1,3-glucanase (GH17 family)